MTPQEKARAWSEIEKMIERVVDPVLRKSMLSELAMRAREEWGYCPSDKDIPDPELVLEEWEQKFFDEVLKGLENDPGFKKLVDDFNLI